MLVIAAGMPRSGSTLQSNIVKFVLENNDIGKRIEWAKDWQSNIEQLESYANENKLYLLKSHYIDDGVIDLAKKCPDRVFFVVSYRDVRDVAASMMHKFDYSFAKCCKRISSSVENIERLREHNVALLEQDYEVLRYDLHLAIGEVLEFLGQKYTQDDIQYIYDIVNIDESFIRSRKKKVRFEKLRRGFAFLFGGRVVFSDQDLMLHPEHVSSHKGESGIWKTMLEDNQAKLLEEKYKNWIK